MNREKNAGLSLFLAPIYAINNPHLNIWEGTKYLLSKWLI